jgi:GTP-binding protein YchF
MQIGIVGLPFAGKTTIFSTLLKHKSGDAGYHKQEAERGVVKVPDERLDRLTAMFKPKRQVNATIEYVKVPGFEGDGKEPKGLPAQFIGNLKTVDAILLVVRDFENAMAPHPFGRIDPAKDIEFINSEFWLSDLALVESRVERLEKNAAKLKDPQNQKDLALMKRCKALLDQEKPLRELALTAEEDHALRGYQFLTLKPLLYVINIAESKIPQAAEIEKNLSRLVTPHCALTSLSAEIEREISELSPADAGVFMADLGIKEPALHKLIRTSYELLGLISFFTAGEDECRSWTIRAGTNAQQAAGVIHSDLEKGFIRAETAHFDDLMKHGRQFSCLQRKRFVAFGREGIYREGRGYFEYSV